MPPAWPRGEGLLSLLLCLSLYVSIWSMLDLPTGRPQSPGQSQRFFLLFISRSFSHLCHRHLYILHGRERERSDLCFCGEEEKPSLSLLFWSLSRFLVRWENPRNLWGWSNSWWINGFMVTYLIWVLLLSWIWLLVGSTFPFSWSSIHIITFLCGLCYFLLR